MKEDHDQLVHDAVSIILSDEDKFSTSLNWAVNYCRQAMTMQGEMLKLQVPYILSNITHWRHPRAKEVRQVLKAHIGRK